jgi:PTH1 family peptidyl-tRNA hydrolase
MAQRERLELICFLGNPGSQYRLTRHNAGWMVVDQHPFSGAEGWNRKFNGVWARLTGQGAPVILLRPETMMNRCGESLQRAAAYFRVAPKNLAVVHDDIELEFGTVELRFGGGLAGHNGLRSVSDRLATRLFWRLRIGVGRPPRGAVRNHVLGRFSKEEEAELPDMLNAAATVLATAIRDGPFASGPIPRR